MFLIEDAHHSILYTGDMRGESTFLNGLLAKPCIVAYTTGIKTLDCIYLDTSAAVGGPEYPEQAEGCRKLVQAISQYPSDTRFYFRALVHWLRRSLARYVLCIHDKNRR